jgi:2-polyprenyl-3-methyl-5-hydroxy-6-metoxy-1,4-benzoquinol methylase
MGEFAKKYDELYQRFGGMAAGPGIETMKAKLWKMAGLKTGMKVLDYGCGPGTMCRFVEEPEMYVGVDTSEKAIEIARERWPEYEFRVHRPGVTELGEFGFFAGMSVFTHVPKRDALGCLKELREAAPLGVLDTLESLPDNPKDWFVRYYTREEWLQLLKRAGLKGSWMCDVQLDDYVHSYYKIERSEG